MSSLCGHRPLVDRDHSRVGLLLGDLLGRSLLGRGLLGSSLGRSLLDGSLLGRRLLGRGLLGGLLGLLRQLDADQLGGALTDGAGLRRHVAQRLLGQLDRLVDVALDLRGSVLEVGLVAQPLQRGLATLDEAVVGRGGVLDEALGGLAQLLGGELAAQFLGALGQVFLQLGQRGATPFDALGGLGAGILGAVAEVDQDLVDGRQGQVGSADGGKQGAFRSSMLVFSAMTNGSFLNY